MSAPARGMDGAIAAQLAADARAIAVALDDSGAERLAHFAALIARWNAKIRLVGPDDALTIAREQIVDALAFARVVQHAETWWDVGSGAGLPGMVLALLEPARRFVLVEPIAKKVAFLEHAAAALALANVAIVHGRVGEGRAGEPASSAPPLPPRPAWTATIGAPRAALTRATFPPALWLPMAERLVGPGGIVVLAVAHEAELEPVAGRIAAIARHVYRIPATGAPRVLVAHRTPPAGA